MQPTAGPKVKTNNLRLSLTTHESLGTLDKVVLECPLTEPPSIVDSDRPLTH